MKSFKIDSIAALKEVAAELAANIKDRDLFLLSGPMGSGKTTFVKLLVEAMGGTSVSSPTFALHQAYLVKGDRSVDHFDLYRLHTFNDLESLGFEDIFAQPQGLVMVEWADRVKPEFWPAEWATHELKFSFSGEKSRKLTIESK